VVIYLAQLSPSITYLSASATPPRCWCCCGRYLAFNSLQRPSSCRSISRSLVRPPHTGRMSDGRTRDAGQLTDRPTDTPVSHTTFTPIQSDD